MKICVTGGAGFIGSHIVDKFIELGNSVTVIDNLSTGKMENVNKNAKFIELDINDEAIHKIFEEEKFDVVCHQAAQMNVRFSVDNPTEDAKTNIIGSLNLYEACKNTGVKKIIFASSGGTIYGEQIYFPADEEHPTNPCSPYGIAKLANEKYLYYYSVSYGIKIVSLRYGNVYGPRQNPKGEAGVVAIFIGKMLTGEQPVINGDGLITRDYIYIDDVVKANVCALDDKIVGIFNVGTGIETNVNTIFHKLKTLTNSDCEEYHGPAKIGEQRRSVISYEKLHKLCGWMPKVQFDEGLKKTVEYFKQNLK
jgi:UDP-glucose 4-epimerase